MMAKQAVMCHRRGVSHTPFIERSMPLRGPRGGCTSSICATLKGGRAPPKVSSPKTK